MRPPRRLAAWRGLWPAAGLVLLAACGGGGDSGTGAFPPGSGSGEFPPGSGSGGFPPGAGTPPFGGGAGGGGATGDGPRPAADPVVVVSDDAIQGTVFGTDGSALSGASVRFAATTLTTNSQGVFSQATAAASPRLVFEGSLASFETLYSVNEVLGDVPSVNILNLTPFGTTATITVANGGSATLGAASVSVPANALVAAGGGAAPATVDVRVTPVNVGNNSGLLSGDYTDSTGTLVQAYGALTITPSVAVDVASGQQLALQIPVSSRSSLTPGTGTLYYFDSVGGRWVPDGSATLVGGASAHYTASVTRFGQWMVGSPVAGAVAVTGCVVDDTGAPAEDVRMASDGVNFSATNADTTDASGQFSVMVPPNSNIVVQGRRGPNLTNALAVSVPGAGLTIPTCFTVPSRNAATVRLTWGASPSDIDSHLHVPGGAHVYYGSRGSITAEPFSNLDVDDVTGFGPEVTTIRRPKVGIYRFYLHNFSGTFSPGMTGSPTRVELNYAGRTVVFTPPSGEGTALYWHLFDLEISSNCSMTLYRYNRWRADQPANPNASGAASECIPA